MNKQHELNELYTKLAKCRKDGDIEGFREVHKKIDELEARNGKQ